MRVKGDWKMGMISDCYQLQENQRKNDPLTVKTPSPLHWFPSCLVDAGRQVVGALSPADPPAASLPSSGPPAMLPDTGAKSSRARSPAKPCASTAPGECRKGTNSSIHPGEGETDRQRITGRITGMAAKFPPVEVVEVVQRVLLALRVLLPSCPPALLPSMHQYRATGPHVKQGEGQAVLFPIR